MADPYLIPETGVLRNKLGITDASELAEADYQIAEASAAELLEFFCSSDRLIQVSMHGWRTVHKALFDDIYDWAGEYRTVFMSKESFRGVSHFCAPDRIGVEGDRALEGLKAALRHHLRWAPLKKVLNGMADAYAALNQVHPFREGNGRSQKIFFTLLALRHGIRLNWGAIAPEAHDVAAVHGFHGDMTMIREQFQAIGDQISND